MVLPFDSALLEKSAEPNKEETRRDPCQCLYYASGEPRKKYRTAITPFLLNAVKVLIPKYWDVKKIPTIREWFREINRSRLMEELIGFQNDLGLRFHGI